jgi:hypothetical protein
LITTIAELNEFHRTYWQQQKHLRERRMAAKTVLEFAIEDWKSEMQSGLPFGYWKSLDYFLAQADQAKQRFGLAQKGGRAEKIDPLQKLILAIVQQEPNIGVEQLLVKLQGTEAVIDEIADGKIYFRSSDAEKIASAKEIVVLRSAKISGLKHRLTRARKKICRENQSR